MSRLSARDIATIAVFLLCGGVVVILALSGRTDWALATLGILASLIGIVARLQFAIRRASVRQQVEDSKASRRDSAQTLRATRKLAGEVADIRREFAAGLSRTRTDVERGLADTADQVAGARTEVKSARAKLLQEVAAAREDVAGVRSAVSGVERMERRLEPDLVTDIQALMQLMSRYAPTAPLPLVAGWAMSPAGLLFLTDAIERRRADLVVECGSGTSTLWMAMAMRRKGSGKVIALEHLEKYADKTRQSLEAHGLSEWAEVRLCRLVEVSTPRGEFLWYDLDVESLPQTVDVLLVDGPPGGTGPHARYPAMPLLGPHLSDDSLVVVDDADRRDEREILGFWADEWSQFTRLGSPGRGIEALERTGSREGTTAS